MKDNKNFKIELLQIISDIENDNVDAVISFDDASSYAVTFFTIKNIQSIMDRYRDTDECLAGSFFWASSMVVLKDLSSNTISQTVRELVHTDEYLAAFKRIS